MRGKTKNELAIIRSKRPFIDRVLIRLFPKTFNRFAECHLSRAYEVMEINSTALHRLVHYAGADCALPGYGDVRDKQRVFPAKK